MRSGCQNCGFTGCGFPGSTHKDSISLKRKSGLKKGRNGHRKRRPAWKRYQKKVTAAVFGTVNFPRPVLFNKPASKTRLDRHDSGDLPDSEVSFSTCPDLHDHGDVAESEDCEIEPSFLRFFHDSGELPASEVSFSTCPDDYGDVSESEECEIEPSFLRFCHVLSNTSWSYVACRHKQLIKISGRRTSLQLPPEMSWKAGHRRPYKLRSKSSRTKPLVNRNKHSCNRFCREGVCSVCVCVCASVWVCVRMPLYLSLFLTHAHTVLSLLFSS